MLLDKTLRRIYDAAYHQKRYTLLRNKAIKLLGGKCIDCDSKFGLFFVPTSLNRIYASEILKAWPAEKALVYIKQHFALKCIVCRRLV